MPYLGHIYTKKQNKTQQNRNKKLHYLTFTIKQESYITSGHPIQVSFIHSFIRHLAGICWRFRSQHWEPPSPQDIEGPCPTLGWELPSGGTHTWYIPVSQPRALLLPLENPLPQGASGGPIVSPSFSAPALLTLTPCSARGC